VVSTTQGLADGETDLNRYKVKGLAVIIILVSWAYTNFPSPLVKDGNPKSVEKDEKARQLAADASKLAIDGSERDGAPHLYGETSAGDHSPHNRDMRAMEELRYEAIKMVENSAADYAALFDKEKDLAATGARVESVINELDKEIKGFRQE
jgi:hypothetical protein